MIIVNSLLIFISLKLMNYEFMSLAIWSVVMTCGMWQRFLTNKVDIITHHLHRVNTVDSGH